MSKRVLVGVITGCHGVKGLLRIKPFTEHPESITDYGPLSTHDGKESFVFTLSHLHKGQVIVKAEGVTSRTQAEELKGTKLYIDRSELPETEEDEFYHVDLIGLQVRSSDGSFEGTVRHISNYGAGDILDIESDREEYTLLFTSESILDVNLDEGYIEISPEFLLSSKVEKK